MNLLQNLRLPRDIATLIHVRGTALPPLQFQDGANRGAKATLDRTPDPVTLLGRQQAADPAMAVAVKAMLYLWNGWLDEAVTVAADAPDVERDYITALAERQRGQAAGAKEAYQALGPQPLFQPLTAFAQETIGQTTHAALLRFRQLLDMVSEWEPFAFIDLYEQSRVGAVCDDVQQVVRKIQSQEFELLFVQSLEATLGTKLPTIASEKEEEAAARTRLRERRREQQRDRDRRRETPAPAAASAARASAAPAAAGTSAQSAQLKIRCPKCSKTIQVSPSLRGQATRCTSCAAQFLVPRTGAPTVTQSAPCIGVRCPQCQQTVSVPATARGKPHACDKCGAQFRVPG